MKLTDAMIRRARAEGDKPLKLPDGAGLYLSVTPSGGRHWRYRYEIGGREKLLTLGAYPAVSLAEARKARLEARAMLDKGQDPGVEKKVRRAAAAAEAANTFEPVARAWYERTRPVWSESHARDVLRNLESDIIPAIGKLPVRTITPRIVLHLVRDVESRSPSVARKVRQQLSAIFVYAIAEDLADTDPAQTVRGAMRPMDEERHHPALVTVEGIRELLAKVEALPAYPSTRLATRMLALTALRSKELRGALPEEFEDLDGPEPTWTVPKERMKGRKRSKRPHKVPLSRQAVEVVKAALQFTGGRGYLFPGVRHSRQELSNGAINRLLERAGYDGAHTPHGFRSSFSTIMNERHSDSEQDRAIIDLMLAHHPGTGVEAIYNRAAYMARRRELAQEWADLIMDGLPPPSELLRLPRTGERE